MQVKFFCSPLLSEKILEGAQKSEPISIEQEPPKEQSLVPSRCLKVEFHKGIIVSEMTENLIMQDNRLKNQYL